MKKKNTEHYFWMFICKHLCVLFILLALLIIPFLILLYVFRCRLYDFSAWGSITAGVVTYVGTVFLGVITYYNTWVHQYQEEKNDLNFEMVYKYGDGIADFVSFQKIDKKHRRFKYEYCTKDDNDVFNKKIDLYKTFLVRNYNKTYPMYLEVVYVAIKIDDNDSFIECTNDIRILSSFNLRESIDYKEKCFLVIGFENKYIDELFKDDMAHSYDMEIIIKVSNNKYEDYFSYIMTDSCSSFEFKKINKSQLKKAKQDYKICEILLDRNEK